MKKGFTLIEIVISISLILIIGTTTTLFILNINRSDNIKKVTKEILEAGNAYIRVEKDDNGNIYANEIINGAKGARVPLQTLVKEGYIKEEQANLVYEYKELDRSDGKDYYVLFVEDSNYCEESEIEIHPSWMNEGKTIYLCEDYVVPECDCNRQNLYEELLKGYDDIPVDSSLDDDDFIDNYNDEYYYFYPKQTGILKYASGTYYYRGNVQDNYVKINNILFRILRFDSNNIRLITEYAIDDNYYNNATGTLNFETLSNESKIVKTLKAWVDDNFADENKNIIRKESDHVFSSNIIVDNVYLNSNSLFQINNRSAYSNEYAGLISASEAMFAGIYPRIFDETPSYFTGGYYVDMSICETFLSSGDSFITFDRTSANQFIGVSNYYHYGNAIASLGMFDEFSKTTNDIPNGTIRPVIEITMMDWRDNKSLITFTGKGTKADPYVIEPIL